MCASGGIKTTFMFGLMESATARNVLVPKLGRDTMRGGGRKDIEATALAGFVDPRSYVQVGTGKRFLFGDDMARLRQNVFARDGFECCGDVDGERCGRIVTRDSGHMHHIKARGEGGDDSLSNCVTLCWKCHAKEHVRPMLRWIS